MKNIIIVRGGGDLATGIVHRLHRCGCRVLILECPMPAAIRRKAAFCEAVYDGSAQVEGVVSRRIATPEECGALWEKGEIPVLVDEAGVSIKEIKPAVVVDAILAKKNLGTLRSMAPLTIGLGPGFTAGEDVDYVVETMRGHDLGRIIERGSVMPNTGTPGIIAGYGKERVIHAPASGLIRNMVDIGDVVERGQTLAIVGDTPVEATLTGVLRGIIREGFPVRKGLKIADIDPRIEQRENCRTISDKARCLAGSVLEIIVGEGSCESSFAVCMGRGPAFERPCMQKGAGLFA